MIASINVTGILLARAVSREKETAIRVALGARRGQILRFVTVESLILFLAGGALGVVLTFWTAPLLEHFRLPTPIAITFDFRPGARTVGFALAASAAAGLLFGLFPAMFATRTAPAAILRAGSATEGRSALRLRASFVTLQIAFSVLLLVAAGLLQRTVRQGLRMALGARPTDILTREMGRGLRTAAIGLALGIGGALLATRLIRNLLYGVDSTDPLTLAAVSLFIAAATLTASFLPARRAARIDPIVALHRQ